MDDGTTSQAGGDSGSVVEKHAVAHVIGHGGQLGVAAARRTGGLSAHQPQLEVSQLSRHSASEPAQMDKGPPGLCTAQGPPDRQFEQHSTDRANDTSERCSKKWAELTWCWCRGRPQRPSVPPGPGRSRSSPQTSTRGQCCRAYRRRVGSSCSAGGILSTHINIRPGTTEGRGVGKRPCSKRKTHCKA